MRPTLSRGPGGQPGAGPGSTKLSQVIDLKAARKDPDHFRAALARRGAAGECLLVDYALRLGRLSGCK